MVAGAITTNVAIVVIAAIAAIAVVRASVTSVRISADPAKWPAVTFRQ